MNEVATNLLTCWKDGRSKSEEIALCRNPSWNEHVLMGRPNIINHSASALARSCKTPYSRVVEHLA